MMQRGPMAEGFVPVVAGVARVPVGQQQHAYHQ
jgi:hypothetical protein